MRKRGGGERNERYRESSRVAYMSSGSGCARSAKASASTGGQAASLNAESGPT